MTMMSSSPYSWNNNHNIADISVFLDCCDKSVTQKWTCQGFRIIFCQIPTIWRCNWSWGSKVSFEIYVPCNFSSSLIGKRTFHCHMSFICYFSCFPRELFPWLSKGLNGGPVQCEWQAQNLKQRTPFANNGTIKRKTGRDDDEQQVKIVLLSFWSVRRWVSQFIVSIVCIMTQIDPRTLSGIVLLVFFLSTRIQIVPRSCTQQAAHLEVHQQKQVFPKESPPTLMIKLFCRRTYVCVDVLRVTGIKLFVIIW